MLLVSVTVPGLLVLVGSELQRARRTCILGTWEAVKLCALGGQPGEVALSARATAV